MLIHNILHHSAVNGPGDRAVVWLAGCDLRCAGCWNPETHAFDLSKERERSAVLREIASIEGIEGVTFSGGEPLQQAPQLYLLATDIREKLPQLSIGMFTGYTLGELESGRWRWKSAHDASWQTGTTRLWTRIKHLVDFAVVGRYNQTVQCTDKPLCGSRNQEVVFFSPRYSEKDLEPQAYEITITADGEKSQLTGFPVGVDLEG